MPILPTDPNTGQSQPLVQSLGDLFSGTNRPQLNAFVANSQARNGLVSAQTQEAMIKAQQAQEELDAHTKLPTALQAAFPDMKGSEAALAATFMIGHFGDAQVALKALGHGLAAGFGGGGPAEQTQGQELAEGKIAGPITTPLESQMPPGSPLAGVPVQASPYAQSEMDLRAKQAALAGTKAAAPQASSLTDDAAYNAAVKYNQFGIMPPLGMGASAAADRKKILDFAAQASVNPNWTPPSWNTSPQSAAPSPQSAAPSPQSAAPSQHPTLQSATNTAANPSDMKAQAAMLTDQTKRTANADASEQTALKQMQIVRDTLAKTDQMGIPYANSIVNLVRNRAFGDPNVSSYQNALSTMRTEYARVISLATGATGITDYAMKMGQDLFPDSLAPEQFEANAAVATREMAARTGSMHEQITNAKRTIHNPVGLAPPAVGPPQAAAPPSLGSTPPTTGGYGGLPSYPNEAAALAAGHKPGDRVFLVDHNSAGTL